MADNKSKDGNETSKVIDFGKVREKRIEEKRRQYERVLFKNVLGAYGVAEGEGLRAIELVDVSATGMSFQLPSYSKNLDGLKVGKEMIFRLYFSEDTYIPMGIKILNRRPCIENGNTYERFGCAIDTNMQSYGTYKTFVEFLTKYAESAHQDKGDLKLFFF